MVVKFDIWNCGMPPAQGRLPRFVPGMPSTLSAYLVSDCVGSRNCLAQVTPKVPSMTKVGEKM